MLLWGGNNGRAHFRWFVVVLLIASGAVGWYSTVAWNSDRWPSGSSRVGLIFGIVAALIMVFECALWPRRWPRVRAWRYLGRTQDWMRAHIWLGLLTIPLVVLHTGFTFGGPVSSLLAGLFAVVILSGVFGLILQTVIPKTLLRDIGGETIYGQIDNVLSQYAQDADTIIGALCGEEYLDIDVERPPLSRPHRREYTISRLLNVKTVPTIAPIQRETLGTAYQTTILPFLRHGSRAVLSLSGPTQITTFFRELRGRMVADAHPAVELLEQWCLNRRDLDRQRWLHWLLHSWLAIHLPISLAMMLVLALHVFVALKYW